MRLHAEFVSNFNSVVLSSPFLHHCCPPLSPDVVTFGENKERDTGEQLKHHFITVEQWPRVV